MMEICWIERGRMRWWAEEETVELCGGDIYVTWPDEPHGAVDDIMEPCSLCYLTLTLPQRARGGWLGLPRREARTLCQQLRDLPARAFRGTAAIGAQFRRAVGYLALTDSPLGASAVRAAVVDLLVQIIQAASEARSPAGRTDQIAQAMRVMNANLTEPLNLDAIAQAVGWSLSHLKSRFRQEVGETPAKFYLRRRVQAALDTARQGDENLAAIAARYGFSSSQYFATCVKRVTGRTPSQLRQ
jgi:AraC-like DNA-binding protein